MYEKLSKDIVANVGGKDNIESVLHCVTRLRFQLKDASKANDSEIKNLKGVVTVMRSGGQFQVVIGEQVPDVYEEVCAVLGISGSNKMNAAGDKSAKKKPFMIALMDYTMSIFGPPMSVLCAAGMLKGIISMLSFLGVMASDSGIYLLMYGISNALFYFFPIILGYTSAEKFRMNKFLGMVIGAAMVYPTIQATDLNLFGMVVNVTYTSTVLPVIFTCLLCSYLEKYFNKVIPSIIRSFVTPLLVLIIGVPIGFIGVGQVANALSDAIVNMVDAVYAISPIIAGFVQGTLWQVLVFLGIHSGIAAVGVMQVISGSPSALMILAKGAPFAQTGAVFAVYLKSKNKALKETSLAATISGIFGVTEPAIYGVTISRLPIFLVACLGGGICGAWYGYTGLLGHNFSGMGIFGLASFLYDGGDSAQILMKAGAGLLVATIIGFFGGLVFFKDDMKTGENIFTNMAGKEKIEKKKKLVNKKEISSPLCGKVIPLSENADQGFANGSMGNGIVIIPQEGKLIAPFDGTVTTLFPTSHAIGLSASDGVEMLIHIGMDTVNLAGKYFTPQVKQGDVIHKGQLLLRFDLEAIKAAGYSINTPVIITNSDKYLDVIETSDKEIDYTNTAFILL